MRDRLTEALKAQNVEYADIRLEDQTNTWVNFHGPDLESIGSARTTGGIVRALYKGGWGYATFNDLDDLPKQVGEACETARLVGREETQFAPSEPIVDVVTARLGKDFRGVPLAEKKALAEEYNQIILKHHPSIQTSRVNYIDSFKHIWFASSQGTYIEEEVPDTNLLMEAVARQGDLIQTVSATGGGLDGYQHADGLQAKASQAAQRAVELLSASPVVGGKYTVITEQRMTGLFTHEAFGHLSEADFVYENPRLQELMQLGKRFGVPGLNIIDDGTYPGGLGTHRYDNEGVPTRKNYLIRDGVLVGRLHSRETAAKMHEPLTGNARAVRFQHPPIVRMTNTYIDPGSAHFADMLKDIKLGVYAVDVVGGQTAMEMFTFSAAYGYMIRDGELAELVRDVVLTGNVFDTLHNIDQIGDDLQWVANSPFGCGKSDQYPLKVGFGGPHIRIQNCLIGGQQ